MSSKAESFIGDYRRCISWDRKKSADIKSMKNICALHLDGVFRVDHCVPVGRKARTSLVGKAEIVVDFKGFAQKLQLSVSIVKCWLRATKIFASLGLRSECIVDR